MIGRLVGISVGWVPLAFLGDGLTVLVLPVLLGGGASTLGLVSFAGLGTAVAVQLAAGVASDRLRSRVDRRTFVGVASVPVLAGLALLGVPIAAVAIGAYLLVQAGAGAIQAPQQTLIPETVDRADHGRAAGFRTAFDLGGGFVAFALLGWLVAAGQVAAALATTGLVLAVAVAAMWLLTPGTSRSVEGGARAVGVTPHGPITALPAGFGPLVLARFLFLLGTYVVGRFLVLLIAERTGGTLSASAGDAGALLAGLTLLTALAAIPAGRAADRLGPRPVMIGGAVAGAAGIATLLPDLGLAGVAAGGLVMAIGNAAFLSATWGAATLLVAPEDAGRSMAIASLGAGLAAAAAGLLGPWIDVAGFTPALAVGVLASLAAIVPVVLTRPASELRSVVA